MWAGLCHFAMLEGKKHLMTSYKHNFTHTHTLEMSNFWSTIQLFSPIWTKPFFSLQKKEGNCHLKKKKKKTSSVPQFFIKTFQLHTRRGGGGGGENTFSSATIAATTRSPAMFPRGQLGERGEDGGRRGEDSGGWWGRGEGRDGGDGGWVGGATRSQLVLVVAQLGQRHLPAQLHHLPEHLLSWRSRRTQTAVNSLCGHEHVVVCQRCVLTILLLDQPLVDVADVGEEITHGGDLKAQRDTRRIKSLNYHVLDELDSLGIAI